MKEIDEEKVAYLLDVLWAESSRPYHALWPQFSPPNTYNKRLYKELLAWEQRTIKNFGEGAYRLSEDNVLSVLSALRYQISTGSFRKNNIGQARRMDKKLRQMFAWQLHSQFNVLCERCEKPLDNFKTIRQGAPQCTTCASATGRLTD